MGERCWESADEAYNRYHDEEWGRPVVDERGLYERFCLEGFQSGLSWLTILRKRENFRAAFAGFDPERVAEFGEADVERLLARRRDRAAPRQDRGRDRQRPRDGRAARFRARAAGARLVVPGRRPGAALARRLAREDARLGGALEGAAQGGLPLRRADDRLRGDAGLRDRQRPSGDLPAGGQPPRRHRAACSTTAFAPCSPASRPRTPTSAPATSRASSARARSPAPPASSCSRSCAPQTDCEVLEIGGSRGYSTIWLAAGVRYLGGRVLSLENDPAKVEAWRANVEEAGLVRLGRARARRRLRDAARDRRRLRRGLPRRREGAVRARSSTPRATSSSRARS